MLGGDLVVSTIPVMDTRWRRRPPGREVVDVRRVWYWPGYGWTVRVHPVHGGKPLVTDAHWFTTEGFEPVEDGP